MKYVVCGIRRVCSMLYGIELNVYVFINIILIISILEISNIRYLCVYEDGDGDAVDADADDAFFALNSDHEIFFTAGGFA